ncbi:MAG TPA: glycoside hydrolase family 88 protein [Bacteroidales bacterium]|nr:glycoside hydrolase family 88 protein [Bacteroidales bacterium]
MKNVQKISRNFRQGLVFLMLLSQVLLVRAQVVANQVSAPVVKRGTSQGDPNARLPYKQDKAPKSWTVATAQTIMARYPDYRKAYWKDWSYVHGYMFYGFEMLYNQTGDARYLNYIKQYIDHFVDENGNYTGDRLTNLDNILTGSSIVALYEYTKDERYKKAALEFRKTFDTYPRSDGQFWHGNKSPNMWIDGIFMGQMFLIRYGKSIGDAAYCYDEAAKQITVFAKHCLKDDSGLYLHAWTENPQATKWADTLTGLSPEVWSEGLGWYALVVPELLAAMPKDHPKRPEVLSIYLRMMQGLKKTQDPVTGGWYMIVDKPNVPGNWVDPSGTAMFVYSIKRGINLGLLDKKTFSKVAERGYSSLFNFVKINENGLVDVHGGGDGITIKKNFDEYVSVKRVLNAKEAVAGFLWASAIMKK